MVLLVVHSLLLPLTWIGMALAFGAGLARLSRAHMLLGLLGLMGAVVSHVYVQGGSELTPWPYLMGVMAGLFAVAAHMAGLGLSALLPGHRSRRAAASRIDRN